MAEIHKFSFAYDGAEDRIAWDAEDTDGAATRLWVTQRLCRGVVRAILPMLDAPVSNDRPATQESQVHSWQQAAAMSEFGKTSGVKTSTETTAGLVREIRITPRGDGVILAFEYGAGQGLVISMSGAALRQTLAELHRLSVAAEWNLDIWPSWIADPNGALAAATPSGSLN